MLLLTYVLGFILVVFVASIGITLARMMGVRIRRSLELRSVDPDEMPRPIRDALRRHGEEIEALGFTSVGAMAEDYLVEGVDEPSYSLLYADGSATSLARMSLAESPTRQQPVEVSFHSFRPDGDMIETVAWRAHRLPPGLPGHRLLDAHTLSFAEQWETHRTRVASGDAPPLVRLDAAGLVDRLGGFWEGARRRELEEGRYVERGEGGLHFGLRWALATIHRTNRGESARLRALADRGGRAAGGSSASTDIAARGADSEEITLAPVLAAHRRREAIERNRSMGYAAKLALLLASLLLFAAVFGIQLSLGALGWLILALFIHELGHALAMRCLGYRDLQILFIPFLGAVASGRKQRVTSWQEVVVLLAGPAPGIAMGTVLLTSGWAPPESALREGAAIMLFLNYFNLLPIVPLDGGRLMSIVLFERLPLARWAFGALGAMTALGIGIRLGEPLLICLGGVLLLASPRQLVHARTLARLERRLRRRAVDQPAIDPLNSVYAELQAPMFDRWNSEAKFQFVRQILDRLQRRFSTAPIAAVSLAVYVALALFPVGYLRYGPRPLTDAGASVGVAREEGGPSGAAQDELGHFVADAARQGQALATREIEKHVASRASAD